MASYYSRMSATDRIVQRFGTGSLGPVSTTEILKRETIMKRAGSRRSIKPGKLIVMWTLGLLRLAPLSRLMAQLDFNCAIVGVESMQQ